ncbi:hypothetical protein T440DRAFT_303509 [Plenodomus tracheiphilus IPT5]|uniref:DUF7732 domain-containing protein n=1 Tax=Plenodomus tracheiphilus IPT5 TaxID=1408161 RepID=A0A6A7BFB0_9PLEO|nr:hypothetical protein T440DRAFT_303509 [Plenodomus tracheiphilus IPT5]
MKFAQSLAFFALATQLSTGASLPEPVSNALSLTHRVVPAAEIVSPDHTLERRKGGGGRGGGSSGGGGSSRTSSTSTAGGATRAGSGPARSFSGGRYYSGGAAVPYKSGSRTPRGLIAGALIAPLVLLSIMPGLWLYNSYPYYYNNPYRFYNQSANNDDNDNNNNNDRRELWNRQTQTGGKNESLPVMCLCQENSVCGCDENDDQQYLNDLIGNGSYAALNKTLVTVSDVNGTKTLVLNGTLPPGTTAPGGTDDDEGAAIKVAMAKYTGYWAMALIVVYGVLL